VSHSYFSRGAPILSQSIDNLKGEIAFRAKLAIQHVSGEVLLPDYYKKEEHDRILSERVNATHDQMRKLAERRIHLSPFLELGAERGQRSLVLVNDFNATGIAADISYQQLTTVEHFGRLFGRPGLPYRVCCDANNLPFRSNSIPFIFCYEFLHHFPSPVPVVKEIHRVLADGYFYFDEEPFKRMLKFVLYRRRAKIYSKRALARSKLFRLLEDLISEPSCDEEEHGILENHDIPLSEWMTALKVFDESDITLVSMNRWQSKLDDRLRLSNVPNFLLGGSISGLCRKKVPVPSNSPASVEDLLGCPNCRTPTHNAGFDRPPLASVSGGLKCVRCGFSYPRRDGVVFLLPPAQLEQLYPDLGFEPRSTAEKDVLLPTDLP
jgi:SAM-dependent methyltransferase/uncharacterized protein YbaR (Trm112 family)